MASNRTAETDADSPVIAQQVLDFRNAILVALIEDPLLDLLAPEQAGPAQAFQMLAAGRLADCQLVGYEAGADAVLDQVAVLLRREMRLGVAQPLEGLQAAFP